MVGGTIKSIVQSNALPADMVDALRALYLLKRDALAKEADALHEAGQAPPAPEPQQPSAQAAPPPRPPPPNIAAAKSVAAPSPDPPMEPKGETAEKATEGSPRKGDAWTSHVAKGAPVSYATLPFQAPAGKLKAWVLALYGNEVSLLQFPKAAQKTSSTTKARMVKMHVVKAPGKSKRA